MSNALTYADRRDTIRDHLSGADRYYHGDALKPGDFALAMPGGDVSSIHSGMRGMRGRICRSEHIDRAAQVAAAYNQTCIVYYGIALDGAYEVYLIPRRK